MGKELDRTTTRDVGEKLNLERKIGRDSLAVPEGDVLLDLTFHTGKINLRNFRDVVYLESRHLYLHPRSNLGW